MNEKKKYKNPLSRSVVIGCIAFTVIFALIMGFSSYRIFYRRMMEQYRAHITGIIQLTLARIDADDLAECIRTKKASEAFEELTVFVDQARQNYSLESLTLVFPMKNGDQYDVMQVVSGLFPEERAGIEQKDIPLPFLGDFITAFLPDGFPEMIYNEYINRYDIKYSETNTAFGRAYDAATTVRDAAGNPVALLIASVSLQEIDSTMRQYRLVIAAGTFVLSILFVFLMILWLKRRVIRPLKEIENVAEDFEEKSRGQKNPDVLVLKNKTIHTGDEMEALADTLVAMSQNMKSYVEELIQSAIEVEGMRQEVTRANNLAMRDALTGVKNKAAYDQQRERLDLDIHAGDAEFGLIMVDLNHLKRINDNYGHDKGNIYIKKMCTLICDIFAHSPVFRVGGDEFIVVLIHRDYENREKLIANFQERMKELADRTDLDEWLRPTAALGLSVYDKNTDTNSDEVLKRADELMYANKKAMKAGRV